MNIKVQGHSLTLEGHSDSIFANFFSLETARQIEAKFHVHVEPPLDGGMVKWSKSHDQYGHHAHVW